MADNLIAQQLKAAIRARRSLSPQERGEDLVRRGVIDTAGRVVLRMPSAPTAMPAKKRGGRSR